LRWDEAQNRILALLVATSLLFTIKIWLGVPSWAASFEPFSPRIDKTQDAGLLALLSPRLILVHSGAETHHGLLRGTEDYAHLWQQGKLLSRVCQAVSGPRRDATAAEVQQARSEANSVEIVFQDTYPLAGVWRLAGVEQNDADILIDRIIIAIQKTPVVYVRILPRLQYAAFSVRADADLGDLAKAPLSPAAPRYVELPEEIGDVRIASGTFVPRDARPMSLMSVQRDPTGATALLSTFFVDVSMLRKVEERDGALIYSDGRRGIRIYPSGAVDYGQPQSGAAEPDKMAAIEKAALFSIDHGGLPGTAYVDRVFPQKSGTSEGTRVRFNFTYAGIPVISSRGVIEVLVGSKGAETFLRNFRLPTDAAGDPGSVLTYREALLALSDKRAKVFGNAAPGPLLAMGLAYLSPGPEEGIEPLRPVWELDFLEWSVTVDAYTGAVSRRAGP